MMLSRTVPSTELYQSLNRLELALLLLDLHHQRRSRVGLGLLGLRLLHFGEDGVLEDLLVFDKNILLLDVGSNKLICKLSYQIFPFELPPLQLDNFALLLQQLLL